MRARGVYVRELARRAGVDRPALIQFLADKRALSSRTLARVMAAMGLGLAPAAGVEADAVRTSLGVAAAEPGVVPPWPGRPSRAKGHAR